MVHKRSPATVVSILRAMAINYSNGHAWDHLDTEVCRQAADYIVEGFARRPSLWVEVRRPDDPTFPRVMTQAQAEEFLRWCNVAPIPTIHTLYEERR